MQKLADALRAAGYRTCNIAYPSTEYEIRALAESYVAPALYDCAGGQSRYHFVTHSMGGIIVRYMASHGMADAIGRVVMLAPPNQGSEVVDILGNLALFEWVNGPAGQELGTDSASLPLQLGAVDFELGVIAGDRSINLLLSGMIEGVDDGKVSVERARIDGMADFLVLPVTHTFIMRDAEAIRQSLYFLKNGQFDARAPDASSE
jgi:hypothetical protein